MVERLFLGLEGILNRDARAKRGGHACPFAGRWASFSACSSAPASFLTPLPGLSCRNLSPVGPTAPGCGLPSLPGLKRGIWMSDKAVECRKRAVKTWQAKRLPYKNGAGAFPDRARHQSEPDFTWRTTRHGSWPSRPGFRRETGERAKRQPCEGQDLGRLA